MPFEKLEPKSLSLCLSVSLGLQNNFRLSIFVVNFDWTDIEIALQEIVPYLFNFGIPKKL